METEKKSSFVTLPGAIIIAAAIIAIAIIWVKKPSSNNQNQAAVLDSSQIDVKLSPISGVDHILGNPNALIRIVEYSDPSCTFCKAFNPTMIEVTNQYGPDGKVAWVYRHYPLDIHPNARRQSEALECASSLGGGSKFWAYEKLLYESDQTTTDTNEGVSKELQNFAKNIGLDLITFNDCLSSGKFKDRIDSSIAEGTTANVSGTPTSFLLLNEPVKTPVANYIENALLQYKIPEDLLYLTKDKKMIVMGGAMPKAMVVGLIETLLRN